MNQLELFHDSGRLDRCFDDPDPASFEMTYYTQWQILYAGSLALEIKRSPLRNEASSFCDESVVTPSIAKTPQLSDVSTSKVGQERANSIVTQEPDSSSISG